MTTTMMLPSQAYSEFQVQVLLERILRRPLWKVKREAMTYKVWTTADESPVDVQWRDISESMANGNVRATAGLQKTLLEFANTGIPDKDGHDITGRVTPGSAKKSSGISGIFRSLFGGGPKDGGEA